MSGSGQSSTSINAEALVIEEGKDYLLEPSDQLPYRLLRSLGHGHSGSVEEVEDIRTGAIYARKTIRIYGPRDKNTRRRIFDNEIKIIRNLASHRHIIRVFATYIAKREVGLILHPVADDGDLDTFLDKVREDIEESVDATGGRRVDEAKIIILKRAFGCLTSGLAFMHRLKVRHKDIKPRNILIHQGLVLYTDFGYSLDSSESNHSTTFGKPEFLTLRYSAPEVLEHDSRNSRSDIFSLGCVFIEILSVLDTTLEINPDWCFGDNLDQLHQQLKNDRSSKPKLLQDISKVCVSMTQHSPSNRPKASQILNMIPQDVGFFCQHCLPKDSTTLVMKDVGYALASVSSPRGDLNISQFPPMPLESSANPTSLPVNNTAFSDSVPFSVEVPGRQPPATNQTATKSDPKLNSGPTAVTQWLWSEAHQNYYYVTIDQQGQYNYHWNKQLFPDALPLNQGSTPQYHQSTPYHGSNSRGYRNMPHQQTSDKSESAPSYTQWAYPRAIDTTTSAKPEPINNSTQYTLPNFTPRRPNQGWYESLDSSYRRRTGSEMYEFFRKGKVFSMLFSEAANENHPRPAFSQIRRYVVVAVKRGFVYACQISTYSGRGTLKRGTDPRDHAIVYFVGTQPTEFLGEHLIKAPIAIRPADPGLTMASASRVNFGRHHSIEMNVKVKDIGNVIPEDLPTLITYSMEAMNDID